ncbi:MAG: hypothetical protein HY273_03165 [Gammaproteobacteria bacterium]|nr:hypothetical protein [Gammaproteobacteria bacterium]
MRACDSRQLAGQLGALTDGIAAYVADYLADREDFGMRTFYGESFALALLAKTGRHDAALEAKLLNAFHRKDRRDPQYHWEFNHYGMLEAGQLTEPLTFKHTPCTNWTLLRSNVRIAAGIDVDTARVEALAKLRRRQRPSGLILDDPGVRSFQNHCFSHEDVWLRAFKRAVDFIRRFILPNGDALYIGRGQQQSFGYASLIYILSAYVALTGDRGALGDATRVAEFLTQSTCADGSLPLVVGASKEPLPHSDTPQCDLRYSGWYAYNNYFDYLPFAGVFLKKAADILSRVPNAAPIFNVQQSYRDADFLKIVCGNTIAVVSRPGGYWTNDLPTPYVYSGGRARMPCYGGEQFGNSIYSLSGLPLPMLGNTSMRRRAISFFVGDRLVVISPLGVLLRRFEIGEGRVCLRNTVISPFQLHDRYLFLSELPVIRSDYALTAVGPAYSASGELMAYESMRVGDVELEFPA